MPDDVKKIAPSVLAHRLVVFGAGYGQKNNLDYINNIIEGIAVPTENWEK